VVVSGSVLNDLGALRLLRDVVRLGSIAAAAQQNGRTQQAVSARMRTLERSLGTQLLARGPAGSVPTETGHLVLDWAEELLEAADRFEAAIGSIGSDAGGRLTVAASLTIAENLLPRWLVQLRQAEEDSRISPTVVDLTAANSTVVTALVRSGACELGFIETPHVPDGLVAVPLRTDELVVVVSPQHPWARRRTSITLDELAGTPLVMREEGSGTRDALAGILAAQQPPLTARPVVELGTTAAVRSAIAGGIAPGVLSRLAVRDDLVLGRLVTVVIDGPALLRPLTAIHKPRPARLSAGAARLLEIARGNGLGEAARG
jgi:DNA-binding transcriptional LysR family regulator